MPDEPPTQLHAMARRLRGGLRRFVERLANEPVQQRPCPECGEPVATEPTESSIRCSACLLGTGDE